MELAIDDSTDVSAEEPTFDPEPADAGARARAEKRLEALAKPPGSLGRLEQLGRRLAGAQHRVPPSAETVRTVVFAASHGVADEREVSAYPPEVTRRMLRTYAAGGGAVNVLVEGAGAELEVVDLGVAGVESRVEATAPDVSVRRERIRPQGTSDLTREPAMFRDEWLRALRVGAEVVDDAVDAGVDILAFGEMGIGNTTAAAASAGRLLDVEADDVTGRGSGVDDERFQEKRRAVASAIARSDVPTDRPLAVLGDVGGLELVALAGAILRAAERRRPVLLDGFIVGVAALAAVEYDAATRGYLIPATRSAVRGHDRVLEALGAGDALLDWEMRLGEASAATLAIPLVRRACDLFDGMATLEQVLEGGASP